MKNAPVFITKTMSFFDDAPWSGLTRQDTTLFPELDSLLHMSDRIPVYELPPLTHIEPPRGSSPEPAALVPSAPNPTAPTPATVPVLPPAPVLAPPVPVLAPAIPAAPVRVVTTFGAQPTTPLPSLLGGARQFLKCGRCQQGTFVIALTTRTCSMCGQGARITVGCAACRAGGCLPCHLRHSQNLQAAPRIQAVPQTAPRIQAAPQTAATPVPRDTPPLVSHEAPVERPKISGLMMRCRVCEISVRRTYAQQHWHTMRHLRRMQMTHVAARYCSLACTNTHARPWVSYTEHVAAPLKMQLEPVTPYCCGHCGGLVMRDR